MRIVGAVSNDRKCVDTLDLSVLAVAAHSRIIESTLTWTVLMLKLVKATMKRTTSFDFRGERR
jgi:hypothetical protein